MIDTGNTSGRSGQESRSGLVTGRVSGLLPWQALVLAFWLGIGAFLAPVACALCLLALWASMHFIGSGRPRLWVSASVFTLGLLWCAFWFPSAAGPLPEEVRTRGKDAFVAVVDQVQGRESDRLRILLKNVRLASGAEVPGKVVLTWEHPLRTPVPGQKVSGRLGLKPIHGFDNPGQWDFERYWLLRNARVRAWTSGDKDALQWGAEPQNSLSGYRLRLVDAVRSAVPDSSGGGLLAAMLTGDRRGVDHETRTLLAVSGLAHTLALSGLHVGFAAAMGPVVAWIICWIFPGVMLRIARARLAVLLSLPFVCAYVWVGWPAMSLVRAGIMFASWGVLLLIGRGRVLVDGLFSAVALILIFSPLSAFDLGLQMSFAAVAGIGFLYPWLSGMLPQWQSRFGRLTLGAARLLCVTLSANIGILPVVCYYFGVLAMNPLVNLIWLPLLGAVVFPPAFFAMIVLGCGAPVAWVSWLFHFAGLSLDAMLAGLRLVEQCGVLPYSTVYRPLWPEALGFVLVLAALVGAGSMRRRHGALLASCGLLLIFSMHSYRMVSLKQGVQLEMLDVGQSQAILVTAPDGSRHLFDCGGSNSRAFDIGQAVTWPRIALNAPPSVESVFLSHSDADHAGGLVWGLRQNALKTLYHNGSPLGEGWLGETLGAALGDFPGEQRALYRGDVVALGGDLVAEILHPVRGVEYNDVNDGSLVVRLTWRGRGLAIIPGDAEAAALKGLLASDLDISAEVLVVPHHGSRGAVTPAMLKKIKPKLALISCGFMNSFRFPSKKTLHALETCDIPVLTAAESGRVLLGWRTPFGPFERRETGIAETALSLY